MASIYTVGQVNNYIKRMFNQDFALNNIYIKGEVSNCKYHTSGHIYFTLKDRTGVISAIMFAGNRSGLKFKMEEGQKELETKEFSASAGGGAVEVTINGKKEITSIKLAEEIVDPEDIETLQDAIVAAANEALRKADEANAELMGKMTGGLGGFPF